MIPRLKSENMTVYYLFEDMHVVYRENVNIWEDDG